MKLFTDIFRRQDAQQIAKEQLFEAERQAIQHLAAGEHHEALAKMYTARVARLRTALNQRVPS
ncbi:MAG: hypothetical protein ACREUV_04185 [Burkholderiales bacterium]